MDLRAALQTLPFNSLTDQQAVDAFAVVVSLPYDEQLYHWNGVTKALFRQGINPALVIGMVPILSQCVGWDTFDRCVAAGIDFASDENRALIQSLETSDPPEAVILLEGMLAIGRPTAPTWSALGITAAPLLQDVVAARATIAAEHERTRITAAWNATINALDAGTITTYAEAVAAFGSH
jgi:hypothetical protein